MKFHIKEQLRKISYPKTTNLKPPFEPIKTKGAPKKIKQIHDDNSMKQSPPLFEHVDSYFLDSPTPKSQKKCLQGCSH